MRSAILVVLAVLVLQVEWTLPCTFQREDVLHVEHLHGFTTTEANCFAKCLNQQMCIGLCYGQGSVTCYLFADGDKEQRSSAAYQCYSLHRDSVKPPQYTRKLSFIKTASGWTLKLYGEKQVAD
ncbi:unnamed protein product [Cylicocyclus nassatus]|uniref:Apple domain-containing protein n=1 Tax=Cylicocyclus nassatus TaxID=53992 RepID=A0AA36H892_CYLNA|nr:unnamed protein product [Cylicocyclus nassatus]